jgi:prophage regulatory protein
MALAAVVERIPLRDPLLTVEDEAALGRSWKRTLTLKARTNWTRCEQRFRGYAETVEVKVPSAPLRKTSAPFQLREKNSGQPVPPQRFLPKKLPQSQDSTHASLQGTADALEDVSFLRLPEVKAVTGLSKSSLYALIRANSFPAPVRLGPRTVAWVRSEIKQWAAERVLTSRLTTLRSGSKRMPQPAIRAAWAACPSSSR